MQGHRCWIWWSILGLAVALAALPLKAPKPLAADTSDIAVSAERALSHVEVIASNPHPMGSPESAEVRGYLVEQMSSFGLEVQEQVFSAPDIYNNPSAAIEAVNIVSRLEGANSAGAILFVAHYDTVPSTPGANDNTVAVAALLESARALSIESQLTNDIMFLFTDGEEPFPRFGSPVFIQEHPWFQDVAFVVNLEANGGGGPSQLVELSGSETMLIDDLKRSDPEPVAYSFTTEIAELIGDVGTDFDLFSNAGLPGLHFAYLVGSPIYHTEWDNLDRVGMASLQHHLNHVHAVAHYYGNTNFAGMTDEAGSNYVTLGTWWVISHPDWLTVPVAAIALALLTWSGVRRWGFGRWLTGLGVASGLFLATTVVGWVAWQMIASAIPRIGVIESYTYFAGLLVLATVGAWLIVRRRRELVDGVLAIWAVLGLTAALAAPGMGYVFAWPALAAGVWMATRGVASRIAGYATLASAIALNLAWVDTLFVFAQPRPGNPDSELIPLGGLALALAVLVALVVIATMSEPPGATRFEPLRPLQVNRP